MNFNLKKKFIVNNFIYSYTYCRKVPPQSNASLNKAFTLPQYCCKTDAHSHVSLFPIKIPPSSKEQCALSLAVSEEDT